jgi:type II secretory pathway pseudopilin PulG
LLEEVGVWGRVEGLVGLEVSLHLRESIDEKGNFPQKGSVEVLAKTLYGEGRLSLCEGYHEDMRARGFTLIESLVVVGILILLFAISVRGYNALTQRQAEESAKAYLKEVADKTVRYFAIAQGYGLGAATILPAIFPQTAPLDGVSSSGGNLLYTLPSGEGVVLLPSFLPPSTGGQQAFSCVQAQLSTLPNGTPTGLSNLRAPLPRMKCLFIGFYQGGSSASYLPEIGFIGTPGSGTQSGRTFVERRILP